MNARRDSSDGPESGSMVGRALLAGAVVFAAAATGLLVLTEEQRWLRLGIVAALWAALTGAFLAARYRRQLTDQREALAERQRIYELELEREIAARREHELEVEAEAKRKAEESSRDDIAALRSELQNMRQNLESLLNGEFLVERYALRAEATRMRSLEEDRSVGMRHLPPAVVQPANVVVPQAMREGETEMIERIREVQQKPRREPAPQRPEPRAADMRPPSPPRPSRPERTTPEPVKQAPRPTHPAEVSDRWFVPDGLADPQPPRRSEQPRRPEPQRPADPPPARRPTTGWDTGEQEWGPSWEQKREEPAARRPEPVGGTGPQQGLPYETAGQPAAAANDWLSQYNQPLGPQPRGGTGPQPAAAVSRAYVPPQPRQEPAPPTRPTPVQIPTTPTPAQQLPTAAIPVQQEEAAQEEPGGGRRRRAEGQPSWQETGSHRAAEEPSGSHASGRSVSELLATHGLDTSPRRRRRRED